MPRNSVIRWLAVSVVVLMIVSADPVLACPNCRDSLADHDPAYSGIVQGFFWSIVIMLATPFLILAGLGSYFYWLIRQSQKQPASSAPSGAMGASMPLPNAHMSGVHA